MATRTRTPDPQRPTDDEPERDTPLVEVSRGELIDGEKISPAEWIIGGAAAVLLAALRWFSISSHPWNSDEPQHLHVVWGWTAGLLPYRDFFDNHTPLFHVLCAPLLLWFGERADIVPLMRLAMIPIFAFSLWCVFRLGAVLYSRRAGLLAAPLAAFFVPFFFRMGEFRTDVLWSALWLGALVVLVDGTLTPKRLFCAALILGAAFGVSMKTTLLLVTILCAGAGAWIADRRWGPAANQSGSRPAKPQRWQYPAAALAGLLVVPGAVVGFFAAHGALHPLYDCVIHHNMLPGDNLAQMITKHLRSRSMLSLIPVLAGAAAMLPALTSEPRRGVRRLFLLLTTGLFYPLLHGLWPVITTQDYLPWFPLLPIFLAPLLLSAGKFLEAKSGSWIPQMALPLLVLAGLAGWIFEEEPIRGHPNAKHIAALASVLRLTDPGEYVLDTKGETIFRPRPCYLVLESLTKRQMENGTIIDDLVPRLIETRTAVVRMSARMPADVKDFVEQNYLTIEHARVLGKALPPARDGVVTFDVAIAERYAFEVRSGAANGTIDGEPLSDSVWLSAGRHELRLAHPAREVVIIWARAKERGGSLDHYFGRDRTM